MKESVKVQLYTTRQLNWNKFMKRCVRCNKLLPPVVPNTMQPCPYCGYAEGAEHLDTLDGEPAGPSIIKKWARWLVFGITAFAVGGSLWLTLQLHNSLQGMLNAWF